MNILDSHYQNKPKKRKNKKTNSRCTRRESLAIKKTCHRFVNFSVVGLNVNP